MLCFQIVIKGNHLIWSGSLHMIHFTQTHLQLYLHNVSIIVRLTGCVGVSSTLLCVLDCFFSLLPSCSSTSSSSSVSSSVKLDSGLSSSSCIKRSDWIELVFTEHFPFLNTVQYWKSLVILYPHSMDYFLTWARLLASSSSSSSFLLCRRTRALCLTRFSCSRGRSCSSWTLLLSSWNSGQNLSNSVNTDIYTCREKAHTHEAYIPTDRNTIQTILSDTTCASLKM